MTTTSAYLERVLQHLIDNPAIIDLDFSRLRTTPNTCLMSGKVIFADSSTLHFSEYGELNDNSEIEVKKYSFHWTDSSEQFLQRWDNAAHYPQLPNFPYHTHAGEESNVQPSQAMNLLQIVQLVAGMLDG